MNAISSPNRLLTLEAQGLLVRLEQVKPLALLDASVPAAQISMPAQRAIEKHLDTGRKLLRRQILEYLTWLKFDSGNSAAVAQRRYTMLRLKFNAVLSKFDIFADVVTQRSEHETGIWLSGLDALAADAIKLPGYINPPPVICYLDRGGGAAIRRARTRLPGGGDNPVGVIRIPRERMIGSGIASSLVHEVGHQAAACLDLVNSLRNEIKQIDQSGSKNLHWQFWDRWISEIIADFWSVARIGVGSTLGLMGVVSLPRAFVFRVSMDDPHPIPWIRVKLSCVIGQALYPHPQWRQLSNLWEQYYPLTGLETRKIYLLQKLEAGMPEFVEMLINHKPARLKGRSLKQVMNLEKRQPEHLANLFKQWEIAKPKMYNTQPSIFFAVLGQAKLEGKIMAKREARLLIKLLRYWALHYSQKHSLSTLNT